MVVLAGYAGGVFAFLQHSLSAELDRALHDDLEVAEQMVERTPAGSIGWRAEHDDEDEAVPGGWVEIWSPEETLLYARPSPGIPSHAAVRTLSKPYDVGGLPVVIRVARSEEQLRRGLRELFLVMGIGFPLAIGVAGLGGYALARRA